MKITKNTKICLSIIVTGKCNLNCEYCHFYANHDRKKYNRNIDAKLFRRYVDYIKYLQTITPFVEVRFSGGEPLFMGDELFELSNYLYKETNIKPYIMTNGKLLSKEIMEKAKKNNIDSFVVSIENPFVDVVGSVETEKTLEKIMELNNDDVPINFGMLVVTNEQFKNIEKIADYFYTRIKQIPPLCEMNYLPYKSPNAQQFNDLYINVKNVVKKYNGKTNVSLFPYVVPEYYPNNQDGTEFLTELPIDDKHGILNISNDEMIKRTEKQMDRSFFEYECPNKECDWYQDCRHIKWVWKMNTDQISSEQKMKDYCEFKKIISNAYYDALVGSDENGI